MRIDIRKSLVTLLLATVFCTAAFSAFGADGNRAPVAKPMTAREAFVEMPVKVLDLLKRSTRLDMLDYYDVDSLWQATNTMDGVSVLEQVDSTYLRVRLTPASSLQIAMLPSKEKGGQVIMTLYTVGKKGEAADTDMEFYDTDMNLLPRERFFRHPEVKDFFHFPKNERDVLKEVEKEIEFPTVEYTAAPAPSGAISLSGTLTSERRVSLELKEKMAPYALASRDWVWNGKQWRLQPLPK